MNNPIIESTPGSAIERPEMVEPNSTSSRRLYRESRIDHSPCTRVFIVIRWDLA